MHVWKVGWAGDMCTPIPRTLYAYGLWDYLQLMCCVNYPPTAHKQWSIHYTEYRHWFGTLCQCKRLDNVSGEFVRGASWRAHNPPMQSFCDQAAVPELIICIWTRHNIKYTTTHNKVNFRSHFFSHRLHRVPSHATATLLAVWRAAMPTSNLVSSHRQNNHLLIHTKHWQTRNICQRSAYILYSK